MYQFQQIPQLPQYPILVANPILIARLTDSKNYLPIDTRTASVHLQNQISMNVNDFDSHVSAAKYNLKGQEFLVLHPYLDAANEDLSRHLDEIKENIAALGGMALSTARDVANCTQLQEFDISQYKAILYVESLLNDLAIIIPQIALVINYLSSIDCDSCGILEKLSRKLKLHQWKLSTYLQ